ncbi:MAG TPA: type II toxin-antitoxin system VapC family toxin [Thermoanaerobaculia bacterium]|nr:type II toxin-antitoxin system VapC family toxin [Thermoanaerobaculia bacterium]
MILLDTHVWLWLNIAVEEIPSEILKTLKQREQKIYLSAASAWEIAIKHASGKLPLPLPPEAYIPSRMEMNGILPLPILHGHAVKAASLPPHHRDPFDRMLIAQAQVENLRLVTADPWMSDYDVEILWR